MEQKPVFAKCRRGSDVITAGQSCDSKQANVNSIPGSGTVSFTCVKCKYRWSVQTGGAFNY